MDENRMTPEGLRAALADLESRQRAAGSTVTDFLARSSAVASETAVSETAVSETSLSDAAESRGSTTADTTADTTSDTTGPDAAGSRASDGHRAQAGADAAWEPVRVSASWFGVPGRVARTVAAAAAFAAQTSIPTSCLNETDLIETAIQLGRLQQVREVMLVRVVGELEARGVDSPGGLSRVDWLRALDPTLTAPQAKAIVTAAKAFTQPRWEALAAAVTGGLPGASPGAPPTSTTSGTTGADSSSVSVGKAALVVDFFDRVCKVADPDELDQAVTDLTDQAARLNPEDLAKLIRVVTDQLRPPKDLDDLDRRRRDSRGLWWGQPTANGMVNLKGVFDPEGAAVIKSALDPLSAPRPLKDDAGRLIEDDPRPPHQRRADALIEIIGRGVSSPGASPSTDKAKIHLTFDFDTLAETVRTWANGHPGWPSAAAPGGATEGRRSGPLATGVCLSGDVLSPATVRRLACDAGIIPVVLGSLGQPLDVGRQERLVTPAMRALLWLRDGGCSFPGCSMPPQWTDAHHVVHWLHGGETSVGNLALLCRRHHTYVHEHELTATVTETGATWHTWQQWKVDRGRPPDADGRGARGP